MYTRTAINRSRSSFTARITVGIGPQPPLGRRFCRDPRRMMDRHGLASRTLNQRILAPAGKLYLHCIPAQTPHHPAASTSARLYLCRTIGFQILKDPFTPVEFIESTHAMPLPPPNPPEAVFQMPLIQAECPASILATQGAMKFLGSITIAFLLLPLLLPFLLSRNWRPPVFHTHHTHHTHHTNSLERPRYHTTYSRRNTASRNAIHIPWHPGTRTPKPYKAGGRRIP